MPHVEGRLTAAGRFAKEQAVYAKPMKVERAEEACYSSFLGINFFPL